MDTGDFGVTCSRSPSASSKHLMRDFFFCIPANISAGMLSTYLLWKPSTLYGSKANSEWKKMWWWTELRKCGHVVRLQQWKGGFEQASPEGRVDREHTVSIMCNLGSGLGVFHVQTQAVYSKDISSVKHTIRSCGGNTHALACRSNTQQQPSYSKWRARVYTAERSQLWQTHTWKSKEVNSDAFDPGYQSDTTPHTQNALPRTCTIKIRNDSTEDESIAVFRVYASVQTHSACQCGGGALPDIISMSL